MAVDPDGGGDDPADEPRANYDYQAHAVERPGLVADLEQRVAGDVRFDRYSRELYATDASAYEMTPIGVVFPRSTSDVKAIVEYCATHEIPVLPRGGGTSLAGQAVNEAVVLDFTRYMDTLLNVDHEAQRARAQPGAYLGDINAELADAGLKFAPDPAWADKSALGGAIGNNSTGAHSLVYEKTDAYIEEVEVVLADGTVTTFGEVAMETIRDRADPAGDLRAQIYAEIVSIVDDAADEVDARYPELKRNVSGYNLDRLVEEARTGTVNLGRLLAGSEGTLAVVTEAEVSLVPVPTTKAVALLIYTDLIEAMEDVAPILEHDPAAVEVMDDVLLDLARETEEFGEVVGLLPDHTDAVLLVEFYAEDDDAGRAKVADLIADRVGVVETGASPTGMVQTAAPQRAVDAMEAHAPADRERFWKMRKSGLPILLGRTSDEKHIAFIEDTAVPAENLPEYVTDFREVLADNGTYASFYAHAGPGVLHIRPLVNTKTIEGMAQMEAIADAATDLVVEYGGSVSGEHGDGRARTQWNRKLYGDRLWEVFRDLKTAFDPTWILNPGQVCGDVDMTDNLRFDSNYAFDAGFDPTLRWPNENGLQGMTELCHGCGGCRGPQQTTGSVMCPTFRASREEITSTRGRANMLRQAMSGDLEATDVEFMHEVLDLCIGCKGCARDCPSEVDLAKLKAEVTHAYHDRHGATLRDRMFANIEELSRIASALAPLSNAPARLPGARWVLEKTVGIARERALPPFHRTTFVDRLGTRKPAVTTDDADHRVLIFPDTYTNYSHPTAGMAAVEVLEAANVHVRSAPVRDSGRPAFSKGFLEKACQRARSVVETLAPWVEAGWDVVVVEPSDAVMLQSDYPDLIAGDDVAAVMSATYGVSEYLEVHGLAPGFSDQDQHLTYHGHCHQKATNRAGHAVTMLERAGYEVDRLDSGCCGMAGSFGYEAEHYSMSMAIARILYRQVEESPGDTIVAPGASCRTQLGERYTDPVHPVEKLADALE